MTVSTSTNLVQHATNGATVAFNIPFKFFANSDINAIVTIGGVDTTLVLDTDFTLTGVGTDAGGTLTTAVVYAAGQITIFREVPLTQEIDYISNDPFPAEVTEEAFDRQVMISQQLSEQIDRAITLPITSSASGEIPALVADQLLGANSTATALEFKALPAGTAVYSSIANTQIGTATAEAVTPDGLASIWQQGSNIATAATLSKPADANLGGYYFLTGVTNVSALWSGAKAGRRLQFEVVTGGWTLTNGASLICKSGANIVTAAGDTFEMVAEAANVWRMLEYNKASGQALIADALPNNTAVAVATIIMQSYI